MQIWQASYAEQYELHRETIDRQVQDVWERSPFYREIWGARPARGAFEEVPLVSKRDLHRALETGLLGSNLACDPAELAHIHTSSGTSGKPTYFGLTRSDYEAWMRTFARGFTLAGIRSGDRVLHAFAMSKGYAGGVPMIEAFEAMGCVALPLGAEAGSLRLVDAVSRLEPSVLYCSPSMARRLAVSYEEETGRKAADSSIRIVLTGGEPGAGDPDSKRQLSEAWGANVRECGGGTDVCPLMVAECEAKNGLHFIAGDDVFFELIDPETAAPVALKGRAEGEIVYTHLHRRANPIVRMRHGDMVEIDVAPCACGLAAPRLRFKGRSDDMLIVRGVKLYPSSIQSVVSQFSPDLAGPFAIRKARPGVTDEALRVVCEGKGEPSVKERFESRARDLLGVRVICEIVPQGTLDRGGSTKTAWILTDE